MFEAFDKILERLNKSSFRSRFHLSLKDKEYIAKNGIDVIEKHSIDFIEKRLSSAYPNNDGKQTPMRGHPVFIAQHATATCCRNCLYKWHHIEMGKPLTYCEKDFIKGLIMYWINKQIKV